MRARQNEGLTRGTHQGEIGCIFDIGRTGVGMTRVRRKLLLRGDLATLYRHLFFGDFLAYGKGV